MSIEISVSPSSLDRVNLCGASAIEAAKAPKTTSAVQERGTDMHLVLATALVDSDEAAQALFPLMNISNPLTAKGQLNEIWHGTMPETLLVERKHDLTFLGMAPTGRENEWQSDVEWTEGPHGFVADYKSGTTDYGDVNESHQFRSYLAAKVKEEGLDGGYLALVQPAKFGGVQLSRYFKAEELEKWAFDTKCYLDDIRAGHSVAAAYNPSPKACAWCPAKATCEAAKGAAQERKNERDDVQSQALILGGAAAAQPLELKTNMPEVILALDAETVGNAQDLEAKALGFVEITDANANEAGKLRQLITKTIAVVEDRRKIGKRPILDLSNAWEAIFKDASTPLNAGKDHLSKLLAGYESERFRKIQEAEAKKRKEEEDHRKAVEAAEKKGRPAPPPPPPAAPIAPLAAIAGMKKPKMVKKWEVLNDKKIPKEFQRVIVNDALVATAVEDGQLPLGNHKWIKVWEEPKLSSR